MKQVFVNNFSALVAQTFGIEDTSLYLDSAADLPALADGDYLLLTVYRKTGVEEREHEVIKVTGITGNMLTVVRSVEGAAVSQFLAGDFVEARLTAGSMSMIGVLIDSAKSEAISAIPSSLPASDVPAWAKEATKPAYTPSEVGAQPALVSGTNIKTINGVSIPGAGDIAVGYLNIPQNIQSAAYTTVLADQGKHILHPTSDTTARIFTIPANASVAYPVGTAITFVNQVSAGVLTIAITTDTMRLAGAGTTGSRTLAANGVATAIKLTATEWIISGTNLT